MSVAISVVVPVYNTSKYLKQCVESLINQTFQNVEFIFVDDGSTDNSVEILEQYQKLDRRIKILKQKNLHAGVARNNGMREATGKYIIFLDSDDFFDLHMLQGAYACAEKNQAEIVLFGNRKYDNVHKKTISNNLRQGSNLPKGVFSAEDLGEKLFTAISSFPWNKFFLRKFIDVYHLQFAELKKCNDVYFVRMAVALAKRMVFLDKKYVNYRVNLSDSIKEEKNISRMESLIDAGMSIKNGLTDAGKYSGDIKKSAQEYIQNLICRGIIPPYTKESLEGFYISVREHLIPDLFDSPSEFKECSIANNIYNSVDFCDFLYRQLQSERVERINYVPVSSSEVRIGKAMLSIPRWIYKKIKGY